MSATSPESLPQLDYESLSKPECVFAAIWHNPEGTISTEAIAQYYQVSTEYLLDTLNLHHEEIGIPGEKWTPRDAIRIGLLLTSPIATAVRSLALDVIEAYKQPTKRTSIRFLLETTQFVQWSNVTIARILECSRTEVGKIRKELEDSGKILQFKRRKHVREGKEVERENEGSSLLTVGTDSERPSNPDSIVRKVRISSQSHPNCGEEGVLGANLNNSMHTIHFDSGEVGRARDDEFCSVANVDSDNTVVNIPTSTQSNAPVERRYPALYEEAIAQLKLQHQQEIEQLEQQLRAGLETEAEARAIERVKEQLIASQAIAQSKAQQVAELQQQIEKLESLRSLEIENQQLLSRIGELERALEKRPAEEWGNTLTKQAEKRINANTIKVIEAAEPELHLRALAIAPPTDATEAMRLMSLAIGNLAKALNTTQVLSAAAILLQCNPTPEAIAYQVELNQMVYQAVREIRRELQRGCDWNGFWAIASEYEAIKKAYWRELTADEKNLITLLKKEFDSREEVAVSLPPLPLCPSAFQVGTAIAHSDQYSELYIRNGVVTEEINPEEVFVVWSHDIEQRPKRYFKTELRVLEEAKKS